jgi:hypothetical protein
VDGTFRCNVGIDKGDGIIKVLALSGQVVEHIEQLCASRRTVLKPTCALHEIG